LVSTDNLGNPASGGVLTTTSISINGNGQLIAFVSNSANLGALGTQIYLHDVQGSQTVLISKDNVTPTPNPGDAPSNTPSISSDGCFVAFASAAANLGAPANQIHIRGPLAVAGCAGPEQTALVSKDSSGNPANGVGPPVNPAANGNGHFIAFSSSATNLITPPPGNTQIYVRALP
jgi:Tol biopolymer transport system component